MDRPILFSAPMVRALLAGTKTQTRRALRLRPPANAVQVSTWHNPDPRPMFYAWTRDGAPVADHPTAGAEISDWPPAPCPYGMPGDRLWVRETHMDLGGCFLYRADHGAETERALVAPGQRWRPAIHMTRAASRITLEVTGVRAERLQDISQADAMAEGAPPAHPSIDKVSREFGYADFPRSWYAQLWDQINGAGAWDENPWVWVVSFKRAA